ncbi:MAG: hypothetical protein FRX49_00853 [Trebouxia sp. A1-2]|nr:MAG: hypothetical protein FRX49_00853 [Trebouxia sp. A1-2]
MVPGTMSAEVYTMVIRLPTAAMADPKVAGQKGTIPAAHRQEASIAAAVRLGLYSRSTGNLVALLKAPDSSKGFRAAPLHAHILLEQHFPVEPPQQTCCREMAEPSLGSLSRSSDSHRMRLITAAPTVKACMPKSTLPDSPLCDILLEDTTPEGGDATAAHLSNKLQGSPQLLMGAALGDHGSVGIYIAEADQLMAIFQASQPVKYLHCTFAMPTFGKLF